MKDNRRRFIILMLVILLGGIVLILGWELEPKDTKHLAQYYIENSKIETGAVNAVTGIYLNYRIFDTIFEALLLAITIMAAIFLSWRQSDDE